MYNNIQKYYPRFLFFAKILIVFFAYRVISERILDGSSYGFFLNHLTELQAWAIPVVFTLLSLTLINWLIEVMKWKTLATLIRTVSFWDAMKQSLSSLVVSLITPNRIGEYGAKALYFTSAERSRVVLYNFLGNFSQMSATVSFGMLGLWVVSDKMSILDFRSFSWSRIWLLSATLILGALLIGRFWKGFYWKLISGLKMISLRSHLSIFSLSFLKYLVFSHQFYFLLLVLGVELDYFLCLSLISISYLISSLIPGFVLFDWLVKGSVAVVIFGRFGVDEILILSITSVMWLMNFGLPSLAGLFYVISFRRPVLTEEKTLSGR